MDFLNASLEDSSEDEDYLPDITSPARDEDNDDEDDESVVQPPRRRNALPIPVYELEDEDGDVGNGAVNSDDENSRQQESDSDAELSLPSVGGEVELVYDADESQEINDDSGRTQGSPARSESRSSGSRSGSELSLLSVGEEEEEGNGEGGSQEAVSAPVSGFRVRTGPDGQEEIEFASGSESIDEGSDVDLESDEDQGQAPMNPLWRDVIGVVPAIEFAVPISVVSNIADRVTHRRSSLTAIHRIRAIEGRMPLGPRQRITPRMRASDPMAPPRQRPRRGRRRAKKKTPKKRTSTKTVSTPKPLGPLYVDEDWCGNEDYKLYMKIISRIKTNRIVVNVKEENEAVEKMEAQENPNASNGIEIKTDVDDEVPCSSSSLANKQGSPSKAPPKTETSTQGYKLGEVQFDRCGLQKWTWKNKSELKAGHQGKEIMDLIIYVSPEPSGSILHMKLKSVVPANQAHERPGPPLKLSKRDSEREIIYNVTQHYFYHLEPVGIPADLFSTRGLGNRKTILMDFYHFDPQYQRFTFDVVLLESAIVGDHDVHSIPPSRSSAMQDIFTNFLAISPPPPPLEEKTRQKEDIEWFYGQIRKYHQNERLPPSDVPLQPANLKPTLRNYQRDAVHWMLYREGCLEHCIAHSSTDYLEKTNLIEVFLDKMYVPVVLTKHNPPSNESPVTAQAFYNPFTSYVCWNKPSVPPLPSGGILCDEMGLGKTVETLSLILLNKKPIPEELQEHFENHEMVKEETNEESNEKAESSESSSWEEIESDSNSSNNSEDITSNRKRKKPGRGGGKNKKSKRNVSTKAIATNRIYRNRRARAASPCEFSTVQPNTSTAPETEIENDDGGQVSKRPQRKSAQISRMNSKAALDLIEKAIKTRDRRKGAKGGKKKPGQTYEALKILYDSSLSDYKYAEMAKCQPKFHGKFYETDIEVRECFECICGESNDGEWGMTVTTEVVKCSVCGSSQHMECVGFDDDMQILFEKLGRTYLCPHCQALETPFETKSTLIITPQSISHQWIKEIQRHVKDQRLNILFYKGVSTHGYIPPAKLACYDIVITTYSVLSAELDYVDLPHCNSADGRRFRNPKRFMSTPSPLPGVMWWRVCLDEAQMVEGIGTKMSMMAMRIQAVHRWCVTGTPVNKGLQDLFGLFVFLQVFPISYDIWWNALIRDAFFRKETGLLYEVFGQLIWRTGKQHVLDQLGIPPQNEVVHWLNFSPVETHFYKQQFEICSSHILEKIQRLQLATPDVDILNMRLSALDRYVLNGLLAPFLELRQACCHPQIVKGKLISLQKGTLTMEELLDRLVKKTQMECIDDHRQIVGSLNGMAGVHIIKEKWVDASDKYREVLQSADKHKEHFNTDSLQLLHTLENLADLLDGNHAGVPFTLRDSSLRADAEVVKTKYMKKYADAVRAALDTVAPLSQAVEEIQNQFTMHNESWWNVTLKEAQKMQKIDGLITSLKQDLMDVTKKNVKTTNSVADKFHDRYGLERALVPAIIEMDQLRDSVHEGLQELKTKDPNVFVESAIQCHLRQKSGNYYNDSLMAGNKCKLCMYHDNFLLYESVIFKAEKKDKIARTGRNWQQRKLMGDLADELTEKTKDELLQQEAEDLKTTTEHVQLINEELRRGTWGDSETEVLLKGILRFARVNRLSQNISDNGGVHLKLLEAVKKEFRFLRILWRHIYDQVSALDELSQATTRMIAVREDEEIPREQPSSSSKIKQLSSGITEKAVKTQNINLIHFYEIEQKLIKLRSEYLTGKEMLSLHLGQLLYLKTLKRNGYGKKGSLNSEDCPICSIQLGKEWSVLRCGHSFCSDCVKKMCPGTLQSFLCPLCRHSMKFADVSFVDTTENEPEMGPGTSRQAEPLKKVSVKGSHSTKVEAIVETLLKLQESHPGEKCIIFSSWNDVLEIIANALNQNDIMYSLLNKSGRAFHSDLDKFKEREDLQVLLMPLTSGAKGLNIIEATHVCLVEPILNRASELQAIGRVHRIGQTKPTFVHRFYVKRTIEDKLFQILKGQDVSSDEEGCLTVNDLQNLITTTVPS